MDPQLVDRSVDAIELNNSTEGWKKERRVGISLIDRPMRVTIDLQHRYTIRQHPPRH
jgi:hypothetical protein